MKTLNIDFDDIIFEKMGKRKDRLGLTWQEIVLKGLGMGVKDGSSN